MGHRSFHVLLNQLFPVVSHGVWCSPSALCSLFIIFGVDGSWFVYLFFLHCDSNRVQNGFPNGILLFCIHHLTPSSCFLNYNVRIIYPDFPLTGSPVNTCKLCMPLHNHIHGNKLIVTMSKAGDNTFNCLHAFKELSLYDYLSQY